jgi:hypothetical protein
VVCGRGAVFFAGGAGRRGAAFFDGGAGVVFFWDGSCATAGLALVSTPSILLRLP